LVLGWFVFFLFILGGFDIVLIIFLPVSCKERCKSRYKGLCLWIFAEVFTKRRFTPSIFFSYAMVTGSVVTRLTTSQLDFPSSNISLE
jgi:hypothetical protein